jgi:hypothetical protein
MDISMTGIGACARHSISRSSIASSPGDSENLHAATIQTVFRPP